MHISTSILESLIYILTYWAILVSAIYLILIVLKSILKNKIKISYRALHISYLVSLVFFIALSTFAQYEVWNRNTFTQVFSEVSIKSDTPLPGLIALLKPLFSLKHGYLLHYSFTHFASPIVFGLFVSSVFIGLIKLFSVLKPHLIDVDELNVIIAGALAFVWPYSIGFVLVLFGIFLLHNIYNSLRGYNRTQILPSAIFALFALFIIANFLSQSHVVLKDLYIVMP